MFIPGRLDHDQDDEVDFDKMKRGATVTLASMVLGKRPTGHK